jgi:hypothetical protein
MRLRYLFALLATLVLAGVAAPAYADTGHFHSATSSVNSTGALVVAFDERGLGEADVSYLLTAQATALYGCVNGGGWNPDAANKRSVAAQVSVGGSFKPKNGRVVASLSVGPLTAGDFTCPPGQDLTLASVEYTNVVLTDLTNGVSIDVADVSRVFVHLA